MMNKHPRICVPPEAGFLAWLHGEFADYSFSPQAVHDFVLALSKTRKIENWHLDFAALHRELVDLSPRYYAELCDGVYDYYVRRVLRRSVDVIGDKNNSYLREVDRLATLYPQAKFVHIVRDGRAVAASCLELASRSITSRYAPRLPGTLPEIAKRWNEDVETILRSFSTLKSGSHTTVRFEDLVVTPVNELRTLCSFLELPFDMEMLRFHETAAEDGLEPDDFMQWKSKNRMPLQPIEAQRHLNLSAEQNDVFWSIGGANLNRYGYVRT